jgi:hypothetical protein
MQQPDLQLITSAPLPYLLSRPGTSAPDSGAWPVLCFLHGYGEGAPMQIQQALTLHGPLRRGSSPVATGRFLVVAPQLPSRGDLWYLHANAVQQIVSQIHARHQGDPGRTYLTGFSFGGNGVFDLALMQHDFWAALWPVDPTRVPARDPELPVWFSSGEISRSFGQAFIRRLGLLPLHDRPGNRVYVDQGQDHVGTATLAYQDDRIYGWLLAKYRQNPAA